MPARPYKLLAAIPMVFFCSIFCGAQEHAAAVNAVKQLSERIQSCSAKVQVAQFKKDWVKVSWGPPSNLRFDVERTASVIAPYKGIIEFQVPYSGGEHKKSREAAQKDTNLRTVFISSIRYELRVSAEGQVSPYVLKVRNSLNGQWSPYDPVDPENICWLTVLK